MIVTGSTSGIGRAIAMRAAHQGARVVVTGRTTARGETVAEEIREAGGDSWFVRTDVTVSDDVERLMATTFERCGRLDGVVANAAGMELFAADGPITEISLETWHGVIEANLTSAFLTAKYGLLAMLDTDGPGSLVFVSSNAALRGINGMDAYTASKGGMVSLTRSITSYYGRYDIRCNCLSVGFVDTTGAFDHFDHAHQRLWDQHLGRIGRPDDVAAVATFLLSDASEYVAGTIIPVDGGAVAASHLRRPMNPDLDGRPRRRPLAPRA